MNDLLTVRHADGVVILGMNNPPVNAIGQALRAALVEAILAARADAGVKAVIIHGEGRSFAAGADIAEFDGVPREPAFRELFAAMESSDKPIVAALHGVALGAGVELALACHYRCALASAKLGLPELTLGIIPGAGGTQRLPRLVGAARALRFIMDARPVDGRAALELGLVDRCIDGDLLEGTLEFVGELLAGGGPWRVTSRLDVDTTGYDEAYVAECRGRAARSMRGQQAPDRLVEAIRAAIDLPFEAGLDREREIGDAALASDESKALRYLFFAERETGKVPGLDRRDKGREIASVGIIGAGTMGGAIAMNFAEIGVPVILLDTTAEAIERGLATVRANYQVSVKRGRFSEADVEQRMALIRPGSGFEALADVDLAIEAVFEDMALKKDIFGKLVAHTRPGTILATNTSTLDINEIAASTPRPEQVIGLHFFSPANVMKLVEIVRGDRTSGQVLGDCIDLTRRIRKVGVVVGVCPGFVGNRMMLEGYFREADRMLLEGATPEQVDRVMYDFGFAMGPFAVQDMAGLDVGYKARIAANAAAHHKAPYHTVADTLAARGRLGQKTGMGFYRYEKGDRKPLHDPATDDVIAEIAGALGIPRAPVSDEEILSRCVLSLVNEGARILEEGIALRAGDIDVIWVSGYGFPRFRGGPMFYADTLGLDKVHARVAACQQRFGDDWAVAPLLQRLAASGGYFCRGTAGN